MAVALYYLISILLLPVVLVGYVIWTINFLLAWRGSGVSGTALGPLSARWRQHNLGNRQDQASDRIMKAMPGVSTLALYLVFGHELLAHRASGYLPRSLRYPFEGEISIQNEEIARQTFFDNVVDHYCAEIAQLVILGAGFDTRAFRLPKDTRVHPFEVDAPKTQAIKRQVLEKAGTDLTRVTFVTTNFETEDWFSQLVASGFDPGQPTLFLWEGVTMYLNRQAVEETLRKIASTARGSVVAFNYFTTVPVESQSLFWRYARTGTRASGEPIKFGIDSTPPPRERLAELLHACGLSLGQQRTLGQETDKQRAWGGFATALVK